MPSTSGRFISRLPGEGAGLLSAWDRSGAKTTTQALLTGLGKDVGNEVVLTDLFPTADPAADNLATIVAALSYLTSRGKRGTLVLPPAVWNISGAITLTAYSGITIKGYGASLKLNRTSNSPFFNAVAAQNIGIKGLTFTSDYAVSGISGQLMSFSNCSGFRIFECVFKDNGIYAADAGAGGCVLFWTPDRGAAGLAFDNRVEKCTFYGTGGIRMESQKNSFADRCTVYNGLNWPFNIKNACDNVWVRFCTVIGSTSHAFAATDDGPSTLGAGIKNSGFIGCQAVGVYSGLLANKVGLGCSFEVAISQGSSATGAVAVDIAGYNQPANYRLRLGELDTVAAFAVTIDSDHQNVNLDNWDGTGTALVQVTANNRRNTNVTLDTWKTTSTLSNPFATSVDASAHQSNIFRQARRGIQFGYASASLMDFPVFGQSLDYNRITFGSTGNITFRSSGADQFFWSLGELALRPASGVVAAMLGTSGALFAKSYVVTRYYSSTVFDSTGTGSPEGVVTAGVGSTYRRTNGSTSTTLYVKESGAGNTGWRSL